MRLETINQFAHTRTGAARKGGEKRGRRPVKEPGYGPSELIRREVSTPVQSVPGCIGDEVSKPRPAGSSTM